MTTHESTTVQAADSPPLWRLLQSTAALVQGVRQGQSLTTLLTKVVPSLRSGTQALSFQVLRQLGTATALRYELAPRRPAPAVDALLCTALALLAAPGDAPYTAFTLVNQAVETAKRTANTCRQAAFVNACLRRFMRERDALLQRVSSNPIARWNHPTWWIDRLKTDHPQHWQMILQAGQTPAPMDLRVNVQRASVAAQRRELAELCMEAQYLGAATLRLDRSQPVLSLPGFADGKVSVQSATAQRAAPLLLEGLTSNAPRLLDACAAPGGKTAHLLELRPRAEVVALEIDATRATRITDNLERLGLLADVRVADAAQTSSWWQGVPFDGILLDAPCSASGISGRHPDVRWLRRASDIDRLAAEQDRLLAALWPLLVPGGWLLYCTCSVFRQEGQDRVNAFVAHQPDARLAASPGHLLPGHGNERDQDGFFYARLQKQG